MSLQGEHTELLAFGIFARDFRYSSKDDPNTSVSVRASGIMILLAVIYILKMK